MRIHSNEIVTIYAISQALIAEKEAGRIAEHVTFKRLDDHASNTHVVGWEIQLEASQPDRGRRIGSSGSYGTMQGNGYAATYDEWGWLLSAFFALDPGMRVGTASAPRYANRADFDHKTGLTYRPDLLLPMLVAGLWPTFTGRDDYDGGDPYPFLTRSAARRRAGREGAGRLSIEDAEEWARRGWSSLAVLSPRDPASYAAFAHVELIDRVSANAVLDAAEVTA